MVSGVLGELEKMLVEKIYGDTIGWIGAVALLFAYALVSIRRIEGDSPGYQILNLVGVCVYF
jgi:hypothetical protein